MYINYVYKLRNLHWKNMQEWSYFSEKKSTLLSIIIISIIREYILEYIRNHIYVYIFLTKFNCYLEKIVNKTFNGMKFFMVSLRWFLIRLPLRFFWIRQRGGIRAVDACSSACYNFGSISRARRGPKLRRDFRRS